MNDISNSRSLDRKHRHHQGLCLCLGPCRLFRPLRIRARNYEHVWLPHLRVTERFSLRFAKDPGIREEFEGNRGVPVHSVVVFGFSNAHSKFASRPQLYALYQYLKSC